VQPVIICSFCRTGLTTFITNFDQASEVRLMRKLPIQSHMVRAAIKCAHQTSVSKANFEVTETNSNTTFSSYQQKLQTSITGPCRVFISVSRDKKIKIDPETREYSRKKEWHISVAYGVLLLVSQSVSERICIIVT